MPRIGAFGGTQTGQTIIGDRGNRLAAEDMRRRARDQLAGLILQGTTSAAGLASEQYTGAQNRAAAQQAQERDIASQEALAGLARTSAQELEATRQGGLMERLQTEIEAAKQAAEADFPRRVTLENIQASGRRRDPSLKEQLGQGSMASVIQAINEDQALVPEARANISNLLIQRTPPDEAAPEDFTDVGRLGNLLSGFTRTQPGLTLSERQLGGLSEEEMLALLVQASLHSGSSADEQALIDAIESLSGGRQPGVGEPPAQRQEGAYSRSLSSISQALAPEGMTPQGMYARKAGLGGRYLRSRGFFQGPMQTEDQPLSREDLQALLELLTRPDFQNQR